MTPFDIHSFLRDVRTKRAIHAGREHSIQRGKEYQRMPRIQLPTPSPLPMPLDEALRTRRSCRSSAPGIALAFDDISTLLGRSFGLTKDDSRAHPSGGRAYPIETYLLAYRIDGLSRSIFHYRPHEHTLEDLLPIPENIGPTAVHGFSGWPAFSAATIILTALWERNADPYGKFGYILGLIEAGHMGQNAALVSAALGLCACPVESFDDALVTELLDLEPSREQPIYAFTLGARVAKDS